MRHAATSSQLVSNVIHYMLYNKMNSYWGISDVLGCMCFLLLTSWCRVLEKVTGLQLVFHVNRENNFAWLEIILVFICIVWGGETLIAKQGCQKYKLNLLANNNSMYCPKSVAKLTSVFLEQWCVSIRKVPGHKVWV